MIASSARDALRHATHGIHIRLHSHEAFLPLMNGSISLVAYRALLGRLYGFHQALEVALATYADEYPMLQLRARCRAPSLVSDLRFLGWAEHETAALPLCQIHRPFNSLGRLAGCLYVKEGAALGGKLLARKLNALLAPGHDGRSFFAGSARDSELWQNFCAAIETPAVSLEKDAMISAACETFELFEHWMSSPVAEPQVKD